MSPTPVLYDLACKGRNACWSPNTWKTRLALNMKGIHYETIFLEFPEVQPTLAALPGLTPNEGKRPYSVPVMKFPDGTYVMDSRKIADKIETVWPDKPSLHLDASPSAEEVDRMKSDMVRALGPILMLGELNILNDVSVPYFIETREKWIGMSLERVSKEFAGEKAWLAAKQPMEAIAALLKARGGPYILGKTVSYGDFYIVGLLQWGKHMDHAIFQRIVDTDSAFGDLYEACEPWLGKDD